jgi:methylenetetrahydrofolate dehydrogenase (NADP+)/methenyltetrahydrofolate cyclohydrolase
MAARLLNGKDLAQKIRARIAGDVARFRTQVGSPPGLAVIQVGEDPASSVYVRNKEAAAQEVGIDGRVLHLSADSPRERVLATVGELAADSRVHGLLVQLPLPAHLDPWEIQAAVPPAKDVDGFHPENAGKLLLGRADGLVPCTPRGVMALLEEAGAEIKGAEVVVVGRSNIVGKPLALLLLARHATVTLCHSRTRDLPAVCQRADILVAATGVPGLVRGVHIRPGAVVIDVGVNEIRDPEQAEDLLAGQPDRLERFRKTGRALVGDVHFGEAVEKASAITPVPGGVGPLTVALLLENTVTAARRAAGLLR